MVDVNNRGQFCNDTSTIKQKYLRITYLPDIVCTTQATLTDIEASALIAKMSHFTQTHSL
jgi:hypothetical protein